MKYLSLLFTLFFLYSCEKKVDFIPNNQTPKLVVDGTIENNLPPQIVLTVSLGYFNSISPQLATSSFIHNAKITLSNGTLTHQLKEYEFNTGNGYSLYYYSTDSAHLSTEIKGEFGKSYTLNIEYNNQVYQSATSIPVLTKTCDSIWWQKAPNNKDSNKVVLMGRFTDPPGLGNYIRYFTKQNSNPFYPGQKSVFDDKFADGKTYDIQVDRGVNRNEDFNGEEYGYFYKGDTVSLKFCNIDKASYTFWNTWEFAYQSIGNPFASPNKVEGNISNDALGAFCGYAVQYRTLIIPK